MKFFNQTKPAINSSDVWSTTTLTPSRVTTTSTSSSKGSVDSSNLYWNPEQPPPSTWAKQIHSTFEWRHNTITQKCNTELYDPICLNCHYDHCDIIIFGWILLYWVPRRRLLNKIHLKLSYFVNCSWTMVNIYNISLLLGA
jgi:hypothetical protein